MNDPLCADARLILDSLGDGVYVTDVDRRIVYWNRAASKSPAGRPKTWLGRDCFDSLLSHVDKDGHELCGNEYCPLHRSIVTGVGSGAPLVFAQRKDGRRTPVQVTVAPIRNAAGEIIGGVEAFRDISRRFGTWRRQRPSSPFPWNRTCPRMPASISQRTTFRTTSWAATTSGSGNSTPTVRLLPGRRHGTRARRRPLHDAPQFALGPILPASRCRPPRSP